MLIGIETDRGPWVEALIAAGYTVYPVNPLQAARYRERQSCSGAKSDAGDAHVLADVGWTGPTTGPWPGTASWPSRSSCCPRPSEADLVPAAARELRSALREYYPAALAAFDDLAGRTRWICWRRAHARQGRRLTRARIQAALSGGPATGHRAEAERIQTVLRASS